MLDSSQLLINIILQNENQFILIGFFSGQLQTSKNELIESFLDRLAKTKQMPACTAASFSVEIRENFFFFEKVET